MLLLTVLISLTACRTKVSTSTQSKEIAKVEILQEIKNTQDEQKLESETKGETKASTTNSEAAKTFIDLVGQVTMEQPFEMFQVQNGDTLQAIKIKGKADFSIKTYQTKEYDKKDSTINTSINSQLDYKIAKIDKESLKATVNNKTTTNTTEVKKKGFQAGLWVWLGFIVLVYLGYLFFATRFKF